MKASLTFLLLLNFFGCSVVSEHRDWVFMKSVGGITVGIQDINPNWLYIHADISGLKEFSTKPTQINSALAVKSVETKITDGIIKIYVVTTLLSGKYSSTEIRRINISGAKKGMNMVQYLNPDNTTVDLIEIDIH